MIIVITETQEWLRVQRIAPYLYKELEWRGINRGRTLDAQKVDFEVVDNED